MGTIRFAKNICYGADGSSGEIAQAEVAPFRRRTHADNVFEALWAMGIPDAAILARTGTLTVLLYHRIADPIAVFRNGFADNVSATPADFEEQIAYIASRFNPITCETLLDAFAGSAELPPRAALVTFDDGYRDNHDIAMPILQRHSVPATLFVATGCVGSDRPFYWDLAGYCFGRCELTEARVPLLGEVLLRSAEDRNSVLRRWIRAAKLIPDGNKTAAAWSLPKALGVHVPKDAFASTHLSWADLANMTRCGFEVGAHSISHPILTRIPAGQALAEIVGSRDKIQRSLGITVRSFAYPNGSEADFSPMHEGMLLKEGFGVAFSTLSGPCSQRAARLRPFAVRRVSVTTRDTIQRFAVKVSGILPLAEAARAAMFKLRGLLS